MKYLVSIRIDGAERLAEFLTSLSRGATFISASPEDDSSTEESNVRHYTGGKRNKGIRGEDLVLKIMKDRGGICTTTLLKTAFVEKGFAESSLGPTLSRLKDRVSVDEGGLVRYAATATAPSSVNSEKV